MDIDSQTWKYLHEFYEEVDVQLSILNVDQYSCGELLKSKIIEYSSNEEWDKCCTFEGIVENLDGTSVKEELYLELLNIQGHGLHQVILRNFQDRKFEKAVPHIEKMLGAGLASFKHRNSEPDAIASWVSHALASIGTRDAISVIEKYCDSTDPYIAKEMQYRLSKLQNRGEAKT